MKFIFGILQAARYGISGGLTLGKIVIRGKNKLNGCISVQGSKNSILPVMAASLLNSGKTVIQNCPDITDVSQMIKILEYLGCMVKREENVLVIDTRTAESKPIINELAGKLRASSVLIGPLLARFGCVQLAQSGGCNIGKRPIDIHLEAVKRLGAHWELADEYVSIKAGKLFGNDVRLRFPSVGATENAVMLAAGIPGQTHIYNAAKEPEIVHLCEYLELAGAHIRGAGSSKITVIGTEILKDTTYSVPVDRIAFGTYLGALAVSRGRIIFSNCNMKDAAGFLDIFSGMGITFKQTDEGLLAGCDKRCENLNFIQTGPYPEFPTDMQSVVMSVAAVSEKTLRIRENIFENRFKTVKWLRKMGADITCGDEPKTVIVSGVSELYGSKVCGEDLRGTAALVVAGLAAKGETVIENADYIKRGYDGLCGNLKKLGADIKWEDK